MNDFFVTSVCVHLTLVTYRVIWACVFLCVFFSSAFFLQSFIFKLIRSKWNIARVANERERKNSIKHLIQRKFLSNVLINSAFVTSESSKFAHYAHCRPRMPTNGAEVSALCLSFMIHSILIYWGSVCSAYYAVCYAHDFFFSFSLSLSLALFVRCHLCMSLFAISTISIFIL